MNESPHEPTLVGPISDRLLPIVDYHLAYRDPEVIGFGSDEYLATPVHHPMAYALYARAYLNLFAHRGAAHDLLQAEIALQRLESLCARRPGTWGLRFDWRGLPADHPFTITTAICSLAYGLHHELTGDRRTLQLCTASADWLVDGIPWSVRDRGAGPWYSPALPHVLPNVTAMTGAALARAHQITGRRRYHSGANLCRDYIISVQDTLGFWCYGSAGSNVTPTIDPAFVVDALHSGYILDACAEMVSASAGGQPALAETLARGLRFFLDNFFDADGRCIEKLVLDPGDGPRRERLLTNKRLNARGLANDRILVAFPQETRLWGYGAAYGAVARATAVGWHGRTPISATTARILGSQAANPDGRLRYLPDDDRAYPRHEAHLVEGLTAWIAHCAG